MSKIFVTGGAGLLGSAMVKYLVNKGHDVVAYDLVDCEIEGATSHSGSILDTNELGIAMRNCDYVVHFAAMLGVQRTELKRLSCLNINIQGTLNVLENCVKENIKKILFSSSSEVYGEQQIVPITEENPTIPKSIYAVTKLVGEEYLKAYKYTYDLDYSIIRFFNVYGPGQVAEFVMPRFIKAVQHDSQPTIYGTGEQVRSFCYVDDAIEGSALALFNKNANQDIFNIGNDNAIISMKDLAEKVIKIAGKNIKPKFVKMKDSDRKEEREIIRRYCSIEKAKKTLKYNPKISLDEGIKKTYKSKIPESWVDQVKNH
jgi:nucleoside-diphosphate-sugar epimerase